MHACAHGGFVNPGLRDGLLQFVTARTGKRRRANRSPPRRTRSSPAACGAIICVVPTPRATPALHERVVPSFRPTERNVDPSHLSRNDPSFGGRSQERQDSSRAREGCIEQAPNTEMASRPQQSLTADAFVDHVLDRAIKVPPGDRKIVAIAGPPGSGKSTLASHLEGRLTKAGIEAAILPMDGFHYDDEVLIPRGWRPRKGAPHTFDVAGYHALLSRLSANAEADIAVPRFDREIEIARAGARLIPRTVRIIVTEGNYLLLSTPPWANLSSSFWMTALLTPSEQTLRERLTARWEGLGLNAGQIAQKLENNDIPNGRLVLATSAKPDIFVRDA